MTWALKHKGLLISKISFLFFFSLLLFIPFYTFLFSPFNYFCSIQFLFSRSYFPHSFLYFFFFIPFFSFCFPIPSLHSLFPIPFFPLPFSIPRSPSSVSPSSLKRYYFEKFLFNPVQIRVSVATVTRLPEDLKQIKSSLGLILVRLQDAIVDLGE